MDKFNLVDETLGSIQRTALKIAALPAEARGDALDVAHRAYANAMHDMAMDNVAAGRWVETVMTAVRTLIGEIDRDGWFRTGDVGKYDRSGRLELTGREDDVVKIDGKRVALGEVEGCLEQFPKVKAAQARLVSDPFNGSMVVAKVVATAKCAAEEIIDHCARNLAPYKVPRRIEFCEAI